MRAFAVIKKEENSKYASGGRGGSGFNKVGYSDRLEGVSVASLPMVAVKRTTDGNHASITSSFVPQVRNQSEKDTQLLPLYRGRVSTHSRYKIFQKVQEQARVVNIRNVRSAGNLNYSNTPLGGESIFMEQTHMPPSHAKALKEGNAGRRRKIFFRQDEQLNEKNAKEYRTVQSKKNMSSTIKTAVVVATADYDQFPKTKQPIVIPKNQGSVLTVFQISPILPHVF